MATKLLAKRKKQAEANGAERFDMYEFATRLTDVLHESIESGPIWEQSQLVNKLCDQLALEEKKLELMLKPLREAAKLVLPEKILQSAKEAGQMQVWDAALVKCLEQIPVGMTGVVAWATLHRVGATDKQILKNLKSIDRRMIGDGRLELKNKTDWTFWVCDRNGSRSTDVIRGQKKLLVAVRRVMEIGLPMAKTPAAGKAATNGSAKRKKIAKPQAGGKAATNGSAKRKKIAKPQAAGEVSANGSAKRKKTAKPQASGEARPVGRPRKVKRGKRKTLCQLQLEAGT